MPCDVCGHTIQNLGLAGQGRTFWCPRCGSLKVDNDGFIKTDSPKWTQLVDSVPACQRDLATLWKLTNNAWVIDYAKAQLKGREGECLEAVKRVESMDGPFSV